MKLSDIRGERTFDVIADLFDPVANIAEDDAAVELFRRKKLPDGMTPVKFFIQRCRKAVPALLRTHKKDMIAILSTIEGTSPDEFTKSLDLVKLANHCFELLTDDVFRGLFSSAQSADNSSGSAPESTEAPQEPIPLSDTV